MPESGNTPRRWVKDRMVRFFEGTTTVDRLSCVTLMDPFERGQNGCGCIGEC